jgi:hypothetical protein
VAGLLDQSITARLAPACFGFHGHLHADLDATDVPTWLASGAIAIDVISRRS